MATPNKRIRPVALQADLDTLAAVQALESYAPANATYNQENVAGQLSALQGAQEAERAAQAAFDAARDNANDAEWNLHDFVLGLKEQVIAQFGKDSNEVQSLGLKKKSEYKAHTRKAKPAA